VGRGLRKANRLKRIEELLVGSAKGYTIQEIADVLDVHRTTIWRDITELSSNTPIQQSGSHYFIDRREYLSNVHLSRGESLMLYLTLRRLIRQRSHLSPMMLIAMEKLSSALRHPSAFQLPESIHVMQRDHPTDSERSKIWEVLVRGWIERITLRLSYQEPNSSVVYQVEVQPYLFEPAVLSEGVFLVGHSLTHNSLRTFQIDRILGASLSTKQFDRPDDVVVDTMLRHLWGKWHGDELTTVKLLFRDSMVAERVRKTIWLPSQQITDLDDGGVEWSAQVADVFELVPWIRGWGHACEVYEPEELQAAIADVETNFGGITMISRTMSGKLSFSDSFYSSLQEMFDGERIKMCLQCSSCSGICPFGHLMEYHPRKMIAALRAGVFDLVMETDSVWLCVSCYACTEVCPAKIPLTAGLMTRTKEELLMAGNIPSELQDALEYSQRYGNPFGESPKKRIDWTKQMEHDIPIMGKNLQAADVLWFVGDYASYHPRAKLATIAFAKILDALGVDFAILGAAETTDGDSQRMAGERGLFELMAEKNAKTFDRYRFKEIVTTDPHAYNAIKNEYPKLGCSYPVKHYIQFLAERLSSLKPLLKENGKAVITYHDPCYLGRVNEIYDEPREILKAIPGVELAEMAHSGANSLCCGGGGGGMWLDGFSWEKAQSRLSEWRVREAIAASGADREILKPPIPSKKKKRMQNEDLSEGDQVRILAVACPYEAPRFEDAIKMIPEANRLVVRDIAEILVEAMDGEGGKL
jgi:Fe-S oxidoreductase/predicted DNA-binding transcriptional regulator YafY